MLIFTQKNKLKKYLTTSKLGTIGFIPTMGALHEGHLELVRSSKQKCTTTICSIFVNPTQFNNKKDLLNYPNTYSQDVLKLKSINCDILFSPILSEIYPQDITPKKYNFNGLDIHMEGKFRPNHFNGVATIIELFFRLINPHFAFFGEKDLQQLQIIKHLVKQLNLKVQIINVPTKRNENGLALSSRNSLLNTDEKKIAQKIYACLLYCKKNKEQGVSKLEKYICSEINKSNTLKLEYVEFVQLDTLTPIKEFENSNTNAICIAAYIRKVRLIDNIIL